MNIKLRAGNYMFPVRLEERDKYLYLFFGFNRPLLEEVKKMAGAHWCGRDNPPVKCWRVDNCTRNHFTLEYLQGRNPYAPYDAPLIQAESSRPLYQHQLTGKSFLLTRKRCILAGEMGVGKSLDAIEAMEEVLRPEDIAWYVGPKAGVRAFTRELLKWNSKIIPLMYTYEGFTRLLSRGIEESDLPRLIIFDESQKIKNHGSQRSTAARTVTEAMREQYGDDCYIFLMSGTPAPRTPVDWWNQCEVACPGFLAEGHPRVFQSRLEISEKRDNLLTGGAYPHHIAWRDREGICDLCGNPQDHALHKKALTSPFDDGEEIGEPRWTVTCHDYVPAKNEVAELYDRMNGLVLVQFKKDCLDLPEKLYEVIRVKPKVETIRSANMISKTGAMAVTILQRLRELSDGFQYIEQEDGMMTCPLCKGTKEEYSFVGPAPEGIATKVTVEHGEYSEAIRPCSHCGGKGEVKRYKRGIEEVPCPKDDILLEEMESNEDIGRIIIWAGFTGTIDRICAICLKNGWTVLRLDGRGMNAYPEQHDPEELLTAMDLSSPRYEELRDKHKKIAFVGNPKAGGVAITLTAASTEVFYSNDHSGEARMQAEDRAHRAGMSTRALRIVDIIHLPTDLLVLDNLKKKRDLQSLTMGEIQTALEANDE